ncbi:hypothetical protein M885DRAFT_551969, partial [Pelagophyceae sp. CCMP2097]
MLCNGRALGGWKPHWPEFQCPRLWKPLLDTRRVLRQLARLNFEEQRRCSLRDSEACAARERARIAELRDIFARSLPPDRVHAADAPPAMQFDDVYGQFTILCLSEGDEVHNSGPDSTIRDLCRREWVEEEVGGRFRRFIRRLRGHAFALWRRNAASSSSKKFASTLQPAASFAAPPAAR